MKRRLFLPIMFALAIVAVGKLAPPDVAEKALRAFDGVDVPRPKHRDAIRLGERLLFEVGYGVVKAGYGELSISTITEYNGELCYQLQSRAYTNKTFSMVFPVDDITTSFWHTDSFFSLRFEKHLREGRFRADKYIEFDQKKHHAICPDYNIKTYPRVQDVLSSLYYARTLDIDVGDSIPIPNHTDGRNYPIVIACIGRDTIDTPVGRFDCLVVRPTLLTPGLFEHKGDITIWITDDFRKMPVLMKTKIAIGTITARLIEYDSGIKWEE